MNKKTVLSLTATAALSLGIKLGLDHYLAVIQQQRNAVLIKPPYKISDQARLLHNSLRVADLHSDALLWEQDLARKNPAGHVDIPRLVEGNVALQVFSVVTKVPMPEDYLKFSTGPDLITPLAMVELWPPRAWMNLTARALQQARRLRNLERRMAGVFEVVTSSRHLGDFLARRAKDHRLVAGLLSLEGAHAFEGDLQTIDLLYSAGFRIVGLTHLFDNELGGSSLGGNGTGLTAFGRAVVERLEEKGIIIDLAHASPALFQDVLAVTSRPVLVTHTGVKGLCPNARNLGDEAIKKIARWGGVIGIGYDPLFTCAPGVRPVVRSIQYVAELVGVEHVALGSDFDGLIQAPFDAAGIGLITQELLETGFTEREIRLIMGENVLNFLLSNLPSNQEATSSRMS